MKPGRPKLNAKQELLVASLLTEPTHAAAAVKAGVAESTVARWLKLPKFRKAFRRARQAVLETVVGRLTQAALKGVEALERNATCGLPAAEVKAATALVELAVKGSEVLDLTRQVERLEAELQAAKAGQR